jgi:hypothetical protein
LSPLTGQAWSEALSRWSAAEAAETQPELGVAPQRAE